MNKNLLTNQCLNACAPDKEAIAISFCFLLITNSWRRFFTSLDVTVTEINRCYLHNGPPPTSCQIKSLKSCSSHIFSMRMLCAQFLTGLESMDSEINKWNRYTTNIWSKVDLMWTNFLVEVAEIHEVAVVVAERVAVVVVGVVVNDGCLVLVVAESVA